MDGEKQAVDIESMLRRMVVAPRSCDELFELVARKSRRIRAITPRLPMVKRVEMRRVNSAADYTIGLLKRIALTSPFIRDLHPFYRELAETYMDPDEYRRCLARIYGAAKIIAKIRSEVLRKIRLASNAGEAARARREFFGRLYSVLRDLDTCFSRLRGYQLELLKMPSINPFAPSIIIAGPPNVGKSSLLRAITRAKPEVREYPFTTKNVIIGHLELCGVVVQVIDTPGLLDRPLEERNPIERRAIAALRNLNGPVIFIFDPTETCGFSLDYQARVYEDVKSLFGKRVRLLIANKVDIMGLEHAKRIMQVLDPDERRRVIFISALKGTGVEFLLEEIKKEFPLSAQ